MINYIKSSAYNLYQLPIRIGQSISKTLRKPQVISALAVSVVCAGAYFAAFSYIQYSDNLSFRQLEAETYPIEYVYADPSRLPTNETHPQLIEQVGRAAYNTLHVIARNLEPLATLMIMPDQSNLTRAG